jgi:hypothetical protein
MKRQNLLQLKHSQMKMRNRRRRRRGWTLRML